MLECFSLKSFQYGTVLVTNFVRANFSGKFGKFFHFGGHGKENAFRKKFALRESAVVTAYSLQCVRNSGFSSTAYLCALTVEVTASLSVKSFGKVWCASRCPLSRAAVAGAEHTVQSE